MTGLWHGCLGSCGSQIANVRPTHINTGKGLPVRGRWRGRRHASRAAACLRSLTAGPGVRWGRAPCRPAHRHGAGPASGGNAPAPRTAGGCDPRSCCASCGSARAHEHHQHQHGCEMDTVPEDCPWVRRSRSLEHAGMRNNMLSTAGYGPCVKSSAWPGACLRARFDEGGRRGGGDLRSLSRFLLPPGGERSWLRRPLRSPSRDRRPAGELRFSERPDEESEDAPDELSLQCTPHHHLGDPVARRLGMGEVYGSGDAGLTKHWTSARLRSA